MSLYWAVSSIPRRIIFVFVFGTLFDRFSNQCCHSPESNFVSESERRLTLNASFHMSRIVRRGECTAASSFWPFQAIEDKQRSLHLCATTVLQRSLDLLFRAGIFFISLCCLRYCKIYSCISHASSEPCELKTPCVFHIINKGENS